jgi:hypothetical protein
MHRGLMSLAFALATTTAVAKGGKPVEPAPVVSTADIVCSYAPSQSTVVSHISALAGGGTVATTAVANATGLSAVAHSSGAYILTGSGGYIAGTLGTAIVGPIIIGVGVVVGGSAATIELLCAPKNHPEFAAKVKAAAREYYKRSKDLPKEIRRKMKQMTVEIRATIIKAGAEAIEYAQRRSVKIEDEVRDASK